MEAIMEKILERIERAIDKYYIENACNPRFIILSASAWADAAYEVGKAEGLDEYDAITKDLNDYKGIVVAVTHKPGIEDVHVA